jgi:hypothetical protein
MPSLIDGYTAPYLSTPHYKVPAEMVQKPEIFVNHPFRLPEAPTWYGNKWPEEMQKALLGNQSVQQSIETLAPIMEEAYQKSQKA